MSANPLAAPALPRVALYGTFDVLNYGDLLFPHLAHHALGPMLHECVAVSPTRAALGWADTVPTVAVEDAPSLGAMLHLIGGGNIVHVQETPLPTYDAAAFGRAGAYASLWLGAALIAATNNTLLAWNAPGLPAAIVGDALVSLRDLVLAASDYLSVRDAASGVFLGGAETMKPVVLPDTALDLSRVWPAAILRASAHQAFLRHNRTVPEAWTVFHLNARYLDGDIAEAAALVRTTAAAHGTVPVLVAIGPCHGDDALARAVGAELGREALVVDRPAGLKEIAGLIAHAEAYVGSSLHGLITALSFGRPGIVIARPQMVKFAGLLSQLGMPERLLTRWHDAAAAPGRLLGPLSAEEIAAIGRARDLIGQHWIRLRRLLTSAAPMRAVEGRARLRRWIADGVEPRDWRAFTRMIDVPAAPSPTSTAPTCNICNNAEVRPGPVSVVDQVGGGAVCAGCGATARHRAMRVVLDVLRHRGPRRHHCIRFGHNRVLAGGWFLTVQDRDAAAAAPDLPADAADVVACIDMLERAPDPHRLLQAMLRAVRPEGFLFLALRNVPGYRKTLDWHFPRGDRDGEFRKFGEDVEVLVQAALPAATVLVAEPADPVTGIRTRVFVAAHVPEVLAPLLQSEVPVRAPAATKVAA